LHGATIRFTATDALEIGENAGIKANAGRIYASVKEPNGFILYK
jgi:hypothetical protein